MRSPPIGEAGKRWVAEFRIRKLGIRSGLTIQDPQDSGSTGFRIRRIRIDRIQIDRIQIDRIQIDRIQDPPRSGIQDSDSGFRIQDPGSGSRIRIQKPRSGPLDSGFRSVVRDPRFRIRDSGSEIWFQDSGK